MQLFKRITYICLFAALLAILACISIGFIYEKEVKSFIINQLNNRINTPVLVKPENISFSILKNFPNASLEFENIVVLEAVKKTNKDTLLKASNISLQFNIFDIIRKKYSIKKIRLDDGYANLKVDAKGLENYLFLNSDTLLKKDTTSFSFSLEKVVLRNMLIRYRHAPNKLNCSFELFNGTLKGNFNEEQYELDINASLLSHHLIVDKIDYLNEKKMNITSVIKVVKDTYSFDKGQINIADALFDINGLIKATSEETQLNVSLVGSDIKINSLISILPQSFQDYFTTYESDGIFNCNLSLKGPIANNKTPAIKASFEIKNGSLFDNSTNLDLKNIELKGAYNNGREYSSATSTLNIENISAKINNGQLSGSFSIRNFTNPILNAQLDMEGNLADVQQLLKTDTIESIYGNFKIHSSIKGPLKKTTDYTLSDFKSVETSGEITLSNAGFQLKQSTLKIDSINTNFILNNSDILVSNLSGNGLNSDFRINGSFKNILPFLFMKEESVFIDATFKSTHLDLNELLSNKSTSKTNSDSTYSIKISDKLSCILNTEINKINFKSFEATDIKGIIKIENQKLAANPLVLKTMGGTVFFEGLADASPNDNIHVTCHASIQRININTLFIQLENFGQEIITSDNIKGIISADLQMSSSWSKQLEADINKLKVKSDLTIEKGELIKLESLKSLSKFIKLSELERVKFSTLKNQIEIKNKSIFIPKMEIQSSAINLTCSGTHTFENEIDYRIKISLDELLSKRAKNAKKENEEFGREEPEQRRTSLFLSMTGTVEHPIIKYDKKGTIEKIKEDFRIEKENLKNMLREEFGLFRKDSTKTKKKKEEDAFKLEWNHKKEKKNEFEEDDDF